VKISRGRSSRPSLRQHENFTGDVWADPVVVEAEGVSAHVVFFAPRGRTYWHRHDSGQVLWVSGGSGRVYSRTQGGARIRAGDVVWIEPNEEHWHGADDDSLLIHIAISLGGHEWLDEVDDDEYDRFESSL
jgi:quercetin dioxygenase-like cupin family protein